MPTPDPPPPPAPGAKAVLDIHSMDTPFVPLPGPGAMQPYRVAVDSHHNAWLNIWTSDVVLRYEPATSKWTTFDLPTRGTEARYISLLEKDGAMQVIVPYSRTKQDCGDGIPQRRRDRRAAEAGWTIEGVNTQSFAGR